MGKIFQGILGGVSAKVGSVVGASWKGIPTLRIYQPNVSNPRTAAQQTVRAGFKALAQLMSVILASFIKPLWDRDAVRMSGANAFMKANSEAIAGGLDPFTVDLVVSHGKMAKTDITSVDTTGGKLKVVFPSAATGRYALATDKPYILALQEDGKVIFAGRELADASKREDGYIEIPAGELLNEVDASKDLRVYLSFQRADGTITSDSDVLLVEAA